MKRRGALCLFIILQVEIMSGISIETDALGLVSEREPADLQRVGKCGLLDHCS